jgi:glycosyltransferase involved in cell wall biosynthesis
MSDVDIAVIVPVYNASKTIIRALDGVFSQTLLPAEVLLINDGSQDDSLDIIKNSKYKDLVTLITIENSGPANARNVGIRAAKSKWIAFLDADDQWILNDKLEKQLLLAESDQSIVIVDTFAKVYWNKSKTIDVTRVKSGTMFNHFLYQNIINATSSVLAKRTSIVEVGYFDATIKFGEDRLLWALLAQKGSLATVAAFAVYKENHDANLTSKGEENFKYRKLLVSKLLSVSVLSDKKVAEVKLANFEDFLMIGYRNRDPKLYRKFAHRAFSATGKTFLLSKYSLLYVLSYIFWLLPKK